MRRIGRRITLMRMDWDRNKRKSKSKRKIAILKILREVITDS